MILVVDDHVDTCQLVKRLLEGAGLPTVCFTSPLEALESLPRVKPRLMLLDVMMPGMNGIELLSRIRANPATADLPVLMMTATTDEADLAEATRLGAKEILRKGSIDWSTLPERLKPYLA